LQVILSEEMPLQLPCSDDDAEVAWIIQTPKQSLGTEPDNDRKDILIFFLVISFPLSIYLLLDIFDLRIGKNLEP
jgi:hypothetical protein